MSKYKTTKYSYDVAKKYGLVIKPSTNVKKKIDVFRNDIKKYTIKIVINELTAVTLDVIFTYNHIFGCVFFRYSNTYIL